MRVLIGHVLDKLAELSAESVHCVVTSPPYYGLRDYGIEPQVWGGEAGCEHEWGDEQLRADQRSWDSFPAGPHGAISTKKAAAGGPVSQGSFCRHCAAWRGSLGLEPMPALYVEHIVAVFRAVRRVLRKDGTLFLNIGDSYATQAGKGDNVPQTYTTAYRPAKPKDLLGIPWMLAFALRDDGWYLRSEITWAKRAPMPESVTDRPTSATEKVFLLSRSPKYFYDNIAVQEEAADSSQARVGIPRKVAPKDSIRACGSLDGQSQLAVGTVIGEYGGKRNMRNWWLLGPEPFAAAHFATFPTEIPRRAILAGTSAKGVCPKCGAPWVRMVDRKLVATKGNVGNDIKPREPMNNDRGQKWEDTNSVYGRYDSQTIGWHPGCLCVGDNPNLPPIPAIVLDPFAGAGTTLLVAERLQRDAIGIELNSAYATMLESRIREDAGMFASIAAE